MALRTIAMRNSGEKLPVSMHCHNLHCFEEGVILLCRQSLKQDKYHIHLAQLFTIPLIRLKTKNKQILSAKSFGFT